MFLKKVDLINGMQEAEKETLLTSPQMKSAENLEDARRRADEQRTGAEQSQSRASRATEQLQLRKEALESAQAHATKDRQTADTEYHDFCQTAHESDLIIETINATDAPDIPVEVNSNWLEDQENALAEALRKRGSEIRHLDKLNEYLAHANAKHEQAQTSPFLERPKAACHAQPRHSPTALDWCAQAPSDD